MKEDTTKDQRSRNLRWMVFGGVLLAAGCTCVTVQINWPSGQPSAGPMQPMHPAGGNFAPVAGSLSGQPPPVKTTLCTPAISIQPTYADLNLPTPTRTPAAGDIGFKGYLIKSNSTGIATLQNSTFVLYWYVNTQLQQCCTNVDGDPLFCGFTLPSTALYPYRFKLYFRQGQPIPATGDKVYLQGAWTQ